MPNLIQGFLYHELSADGLTDGKPFEALTVGSFVDMSGTPVEISLERLKQIFTNTLAALQARRDANGELFGFPIDSKGHDNGDAAGWIVGVELAGKVLKLIPRWTELGVEKITKKIQRLFSCTIDPNAETIVGGSLTNWPAVKGLEPIELSSHLFQLKTSEVEYRKLIELMLLSDESYSEAEQRVMRAWVDEWQEDHPADPNGMSCAPCPWPVNVYADYLVIRLDGQLTKVPYTDKDGTLTFADEAEWKPVRMVPVEMPAATEDDMEDLEMDKTELLAILEENNKKLKAELAAAPANGNPALALPGATAATNGNSATAATIDLSQFGPQVTPEMVTFVRDQLASRELAAQNMVTAMVAEEREKMRVNRAALNLTDGSKDRKALPIQPARLEAFLLSLNPAQRKDAEAILGEIVKSGVVDFSERGTDGAGDHLKPLPKEVAAYLDEGVSVEKLRTKIMQPVLAEAGVSDLKQYDLSRWPAAQAKVHGAAVAAGAK